MSSTSPFPADAARQRRMDTYGYSSSEDDNDYELQRRFNRSTPQNAGAYDQVSGRFTDTGYHAPAGITPNPTPPPPNTVVPNQQTTMSPSGDLGKRKNGVPATVPHAVATTPQQI